MAQITVDNLTLEISFDSVQYGWINYAVYFRWNDIPVINQKILWAGPEYIGKAEALWVNDGEETLIDTIEHVLTSHQPTFWEPLEPGIEIAFYPGMAFPFILTNIEKAVGKTEETLPPKDTSWIQIIAKVSTSNFIGENYDGAAGISLQMVVQEWQLYNFLKELKQEYQEFFIKHKEEIEGTEEG